MLDPNADTPDNVKPLTTTASNQPLDIEGHRGARGLKPENTLPAFETALDLGVTTLELDMHLTSDNQVVVWHDAKLGADKCRFANEADDSYPEEGIAVASQTMAQLGSIICDLNPDPGRFPDQDNGPTPLAASRYQPLTLSELFAFVADYAQSEEKTEEQRGNAGRVEFNIETKREVDDPSTIGALTGSTLAGLRLKYWPLWKQPEWASASSFRVLITARFGPSGRSPLIFDSQPSPLRGFPI